MLRNPGRLIFEEHLAYREGVETSHLGQDRSEDNAPESRYDTLWLASASWN